MSDPVAFDTRLRRPVWDALSSLFLDTDITTLRAWRARELADSPYSMAELEAILLGEVYPVCRWNLLQVAGAWSGFDLGWLEQRIAARRRSPFRRFSRLDPFRERVRRSAEWQETRRAVIASRGGAG